MLPKNFIFAKFLCDENILKNKTKSDKTPTNKQHFYEPNVSKKFCSHPLWSVLVSLKRCAAVSTHWLFIKLPPPRKFLELYDCEQKQSLQRRNYFFNSKQEQKSALECMTQTQK